MNRRRPRQPLRGDVCGGDAYGVLVLYSLSKQSNMAGYRTACIAGDHTLVRAMTELRKQIGLIVPGLPAIEVRP